MQKKIEWIDALKTIGILAVVLGHIASPLTTFIFSWHMPLFFIVAGFFIKIDRSFKEFFIKDFKRLMIPYFIFAPLGLLAEILKRIVLHRDSLNYFHEVKGILFGMDMNSLLNHYGFVLWFLPAVFFARMFLFLLQKIKTNLLFNSIVVLILFAASFHIELPFAIDNAANVLIWVFTGFVFFNFYQKSKSIYIFLSVVIIIVVYFFSGIPILNVSTKNYNNVLYAIFWAFSIIYILIVALKQADYSNNVFNIMRMWGGNTMLLFIVHPYTNNIAHIVVEKLLPGVWCLKYIISLVMLQVILLIKIKFNNIGIFKYV